MSRLRISRDDLVKLVKELNQLTGRPTEVGGYHKKSGEYVPDVVGSIKLYSGGVPGYTLFEVKESGGMTSCSYMDGIYWARLSTKGMYCFLTGLINGLKLKKKGKK